MPKDPSTLPIEAKAAFLDLAARLEPENLTCDGELSAVEVRTRRAAIMAEWSALSRQHDVEFGSIGDPFMFADEVDAWRKAEEELRRQAWEDECGSDPRVRHGHTGIWARDGQPIGSTGSSYNAYTVTKRPAHTWGDIAFDADDAFTLKSDLMRDLGHRDDVIGRFDTLAEAVDTGEAFLAGITPEVIMSGSRRISSPDDFWAKQILNRLPDEYREPLVAAWAVAAFEEDQSPRPS